MARPSKIDRFIEVAKDVLFRDDLMLLTDEELVFLINEKLEDSEKVSVRTFKLWKSGDKLNCISIYSNKNKHNTGISFVNQKQYQKEYYHKVKKNNINDRIKNSFATLLRHHLKNKSINTFKSVGYSVHELRSHLESLFVDGMSWSNYGRDGWHIDHVRPASWFDYKSQDCESFKDCWCLSNLQPKWASDNMSKGNRYEG